MNKLLISIALGQFIQIAIASSVDSGVNAELVSSEALENMIKGYDANVDYISELFFDVSAYSEDLAVLDIELTQPEARELCLPILKFMEQTKNLSDSDKRIDALLERNAIVVRLSSYSATNQSMIQTECNSQLKGYHKFELHSYLIRVKSLLYLVRMHVVDFDSLRNVGLINSAALTNAVAFVGELRKQYSKLRPPTSNKIYLSRAEPATFEIAKFNLVVGLFPCMVNAKFCTMAQADIASYLHAFYLATGNRHVATTNLLTHWHGEFWTHFRAISDWDWSQVPESSPIISLMVELPKSVEYYNGITELCRLLDDNVRRTVYAIRQVNAVYLGQSDTTAVSLECSLEK